MIKDVPCAFCGATIVSRLFVVCGSCEVPMHQDCWAVSATCPAYGCGSNEVLDPAVVIYRRPRADAVIASTLPAPVTVSLSATPLSSDAAPPARLRARMQRLDAMIADAERALAPHNRRFAATMGLGMLGIIAGMMGAGPAIIFASIFILGLGPAAVGMAMAEPARQLQAVRTERTRLELLLATEES